MEGVREGGREGEREGGGRDRTVLSTAREVSLY